MIYEKFDKILGEAGLNKKQFSQMTGLGYTTVTNWKQVDTVPMWVETWLEYYKDSIKLKTIKELLDDKL